MGRKQLVTADSRSVELVRDGKQASGGADIWELIKQAGVTTPTPRLGPAPSEGSEGATGNPDPSEALTAPADSAPLNEVKPPD